MKVTKSNLVRVVLSELLLISLIFNISAITSLPTAQAAPNLTPKWTANIGPAGRTYVGALAADMVGDSRPEIVILGGTSDGGVDGTVTLLDGNTGNIIWQVNPSGIGMHDSFEIADLDLDGDYEIVVGAVGGVFALNGNDGSMYWRNYIARGEEVALAIQDIDGDGHPEIFVNRGNAPYNGYDWLTVLSYDGQILRQAWSWHPCWGGLTVTDANGDGRFEIYQGDRKIDERADPYKGGAQGIHVFDAHTLTPLWSDKTVLTSSQIPSLADVDGDGILDVVVASQSSNGVVVLNSEDGSVLTTGGIFRKAGTGMKAHETATIYDIDGDGNLEFINCYDSLIKVFDLYTFTLDATLPMVAFQAPRIGE